MPVALKQDKIVAQPTAMAPATSSPIWVEVLLVGAAGLFVSVLLMTYGLDLSPGLF